MVTHAPLVKTDFAATADYFEKSVCWRLRARLLQLIVPPAPAYCSMSRHLGIMSDVCGRDVKHVKYGSERRNH